MANKIFKEKFTGPYDGVIPATLLPKGSIAGGENIRKVSSGGGWKARKGCSIHNTTSAESGSAINSLHQFTHPRNNDYHFIAQSNAKLLNSTNDPPAGGTTFGTTMGVTVGTTPGFSCMVEDRFQYTDETSGILAWGGDDPYPLGMFIYDASETAYVDYTRSVTDGRSDTDAVVLGAAADVAYVITNEPAEEITLTLGTAKNSNAVTMVVEAWRTNAYVAVSSLSDGTETGGTTTLAQSGTVSWTASTSDTMRTIGLVMGYVYKVSWSGAMSGSVDVTACTVKSDMHELSNKWNGIFEWCGGVRFYDQSATEYQEALGDLSNEATSQYLDISSATTSDYIYIKTIEPATGFGFGIPVGYGNVDAAVVDGIDCWDGDSWAATTTGIIDTTLDGSSTKSFSQSGSIFFNATDVIPQMRTFEGDNIPGYWYRLSWDVALSADTRIYLAVVAHFPESLPKYEGCVEFKSRLFVWGDKEFPNRMRYSATRRPDCFSGSDSGYTDALGDMTGVVCAIRFYNELLVFKENSIFLLEGFSPATFGVLKVADTVGLASPKTAHMVEVGYPGMHSDEPLSIAIWQDVDGVYVLDGRKPRKVSLPVDNYFNQEYSDCIPANSIKNRQSYIDPINNEYHLLLSSNELVYNYVLGEWYPVWDREVTIDTAISLKGTDNRYYSYGGSSGGFVMKLEDDTSDKNTSNADVAISHSIKTRAIAPEEELGISLSFTLRRLWTVLKARSAGTITTKLFKNMATSGTTLSTPAAITMVASGEGLTTKTLEISTQGCSCFQVEFSLDVIDQEIEIWSMIYELESRGMLDK